MDSALLVSTPLLGLEPLGNLGDRSHAALTRALSQLGEDYRILLAEPVPAQDGSRIDWYADTAARPVRIADLAGPARAKALETFGSMTERVTERAAELEATDPALAQAMRNALVVPDEGHIFLVDDKIVLAGWAHRRSGMPGYGKPPSVVIAPAEGLPPPPAALPPAAVARAPRPWGAWLLALLLWLLFLAIMAYIYWLSLHACGVRAPFWTFGSCPATVEPLSPAGAEKAEEIAARIRQLEAAIETKRVACDVCRPAGEPIVPPVPVEPEPQPEPEDDMQDRLDEAGAQEGDVQVSLAWEGAADLDLIINCPTGEHIYFQNRNACGGTLDVDMNAPGSRHSDRPVENIFFVDAQMPGGTYKIGVMMYNRNGETRREVPYTVRIKTQSGVETKSGTVSVERTPAQTAQFQH